MIRRLRPRSLYDVLATLAFFGVIAGGTAYAANTVFSTDIVDGQVKTSDLAAGAVVAAKLADETIASDKVKDGALQGRDVLDNTLKGADIDESTLSISGGSPSGSAGGDLTGNYPNPAIKPNAVGSGKVVDNSLTGSDINESTLNLGVTGETVPAVRATAPENPNFFDGECYHEGPTVPLASATTMRFSGEDYDIGGLHTTSTACEAASSRLTAPTTGIYLITGTARWLGEDNNCTGCEYGIREIEILKDGSVTLARDTVPAAVVAGGFEIETFAPNQTVTTVARLAANSYVELLARHNHASHTLQTIDGSGTSFTMTWLGPAP